MLREVNVLDIDNLIDMMLAMRVESPTLVHVPIEAERTAKNLYDMMLNGSFFGLIEKGKGCMLGILGPNWYTSTVEAHEQMLYVYPEWRAKSYGVRLIKAFEKLATEMGATAIHAGSSTGIADERTISLYEKLGYNRAGISVRKQLIV